MNLVNRIPATLILLTTNLVVFAFLYYRIGTFSDPIWTQGLLFNGADFAPLALDKEWYRIFTHLFMHGNLMHLAFNMYALVVAGSEVEGSVGTRKFLLVYFTCGFFACMSSMYFNLFTIGVGASGAIFGLFGFSLVQQINANRKRGTSIVGILVNFAIFIGINLLYARALNADNAAHFGGLLAGIIMGVAALVAVLRKTYFVEVAAMVLMLTVFMVFPRYQVTYFNFFQGVLEAQDQHEEVLSQKMNDEEFRSEMVKLRADWDTVRLMLEAIPRLPEELESDAFKLRRYLDLRKQEADYRIAMIDLQTFRCLDSIEIVQKEIQRYLQLDYPLTMMRPIRQNKADTIPPNNLAQVQVWYDDEWEELSGPPGKYYRMGQRDSAGLWQGPTWDFYADGKVQMKGRYLNSKREGVFLYYSDHDTYESVGRYEDDEVVSKWEEFHDNGRLKYEAFYADKNFLQNAWDEEGNPMVVDGEGTYWENHENGARALVGKIVGGRRTGIWMGWHDDGTIYFEEFFEDGQLVEGRSVSKEGEKFVYDASSLFAMPEGGNEKLVDYLTKRVRALKPEVHGPVRVWFQVTANGALQDFTVINSLTPALDAKAIELIKEGPAWLPARDHGHLPRLGSARVTVHF